MSVPIASDLYDLVVVGAGISGLATTRLAAKRGLAVLLLDRGAIGASTSSNSLRIIHGGFRYLQNLDLPRVVYSLKEQARVVKEFPDLVQELPCYLPLKRFGLKSPIPLIGARFLYRALGKSVGVDTPSTAVLSHDIALSHVPVLEGHVPYGAFRWTDYQLISPSILHQRLAQEAGGAGASILEHSQASYFERGHDHFTVRFANNGTQHEVRARVVVNTTGPWVNSLSLDGVQSHAGVEWCRAFNLVFRGNRYGTFGFALPSTAGRQYFIVGRENEIAIGTEYLDFKGDPVDARVSREEVESFLNRVKDHVPCLSLSMDSLVRVELGVLPVRKGGGDPGESLIGSAQVKERGGYLSLLSTKYTTFLGQADDMVGRVERILVS